MPQPGLIGYKLNNRYEILELLGRGGMSSVYKANDPNLGRIVAIKLIHAHLADDPDFVRRFEVEAKAIAQLRHPNIVQVHDFNRDGDMNYIVLEFIPGETLQFRLKRLKVDRRQLSIEEMVSHMAKVCDGVEYAHQRGLIHRDIKPANIMLDVQGQAILTDFGIVKIVGEKQHTASGAVIGTALYMSPEQIRGETPDHRTDIYSLGVTLYEMASGRPPFEADSAMTIMMMHLNDPVPDITALNPDIPYGLRAITDAALSKNPHERFQSAGEMRDALMALGNEQDPRKVTGSFLMPHPSSERTPPPNGAWRAKMTRLIIGVVGILILVVASTFFISRNTNFFASDGIEQDRSALQEGDVAATESDVFQESSGSITPSLEQALASQPTFTPLPTYTLPPTFTPLSTFTTVPSDTPVPTPSQPEDQGPATPAPAGSPCSLTIGDTYKALGDTRVWSAPDVSVGSILVTLNEGDKIKITNQPKWGSIRVDIVSYGWWYPVEAVDERVSGWVWEGKISECVSR